MKNIYYIVPCNCLTVTEHSFSVFLFWFGFWVFLFVFLELNILAYLYQIFSEGDIPDTGDTAL